MPHVSGACEVCGKRFERLAMHMGRSHPKRTETEKTEAAFVARVEAAFDATLRAIQAVRRGDASPKFAHDVMNAAANEIVNAVRK